MAGVRGGCAGAALGDRQAGDEEGVAELGEHGR